MVPPRRSALLALVALAAAGCGSSSSSSPASSSRPAHRPGRATGTTPAPTAAARRATRARARRYDRAFSALPYHAGPLPVAQTIISEQRPDLLIARLAPQRFFCLGPPARRAAAIRRYYRRARARVRAQGLADLHLVVAPLGRTAQVSVVWARAERDRVALTAAGRQGRCAQR